MLSGKLGGRCRLSILLFLSMMFSSSASVETDLPHALYLAVVQIDHREAGTETTQVLVKVFTDDLQDVIRASYPEQFLRAVPEIFCKLNHKAIERYFRSKLKCRINGGEVTLRFERSTWENEVFWLSFTTKTPKTWDAISVEAAFFTEIFPTQSNIIQITHAGEKRFARLTRENKKADFTF